MARMTLIDINANDELPAVIRKCNDNFRRMSSQQSMDTDLSVRLEGERSDAALADAMAGVAAALSEMRTWVEQAIEGLRTWVVAEIAKMTQPKMFAPPVGTYLYCEQDPAVTWSGTVWEKLDSGLYLVSSDQSGLGNVGSNSVTLATDQMPQHSHSGPSHSHTMAHTHKMSHTHTGRFPVFGWLSRAMLNSENKNFELWRGPNSGDTSTATGDGYGASDRLANHNVTNGPSSSNTAASSAGSTGSSGTGSTGTAGGSRAIDNRPLSVQVPLWKRTA